MASLRAGLLAVTILGVTACGTGSPSRGVEGPAAALTSPASTSPVPGGGEQVELDRQLREAAWQNDVECSRTLIGLGADVNSQDATEQSAYLIASSEGHLDLINLTLAHGAQVDAKDGWNGTALIRAAERGHARVVGGLLKAGIDRDHVNRIGYQAIHEAVWLGQDTTAYVDTVRTLVAGGVELTRASTEERLTPMQMARQRGYVALESVLAAALASTRIADADAALLQAATTGDADQVARALRAGADIQTRDSQRRTALLIAVTHGRDDVTRLLVAVGADSVARA